MVREFKVLSYCTEMKYNGAVAPLAGAWIETSGADNRRLVLFVAPLAGAWIETIHASPDITRELVAPLAGAWIETKKPRPLTKERKSHPSRVRGLKRGGSQVQN